MVIFLNYDAPSRKISFRSMQFLDESISLRADKRGQGVAAKKKKHAKETIKMLSGAITNL